jgi:ribosomal protein S18 acetylase RimI-like enzyme
MAPPSRAELEAIEQSQLDWAQLLGAEIAEEAGAVVIHHNEPGPGFNLTVRVRWHPGESAARLAELEDRARSDNRWPSIIISDGLTEPSDLPTALDAAGWMRVGNERIMFTRHAPVVPHLDPGLRMEAVTAASASEAARLEAEAFGHDWAAGDRARNLVEAVAEGSVRGFLLRLIKEPVASTRLAPMRPGGVGARVAGIHGVSVAARHRRRGYGRMITAVATRAGLVTGHGLVWLSVDEANVAAYNLYRSLGYEPTFAWTRWLAPARD